MRRCGAESCGTAALLYRSQTAGGSGQTRRLRQPPAKTIPHASYIVDFLPELCGERQHANLAARQIEDDFVFSRLVLFCGEICGEIKIVEVEAPAGRARPRACLSGQPRVRFCCPFRVGFWTHPLPQLSCALCRTCSSLCRRTRRFGSKAGRRCAPRPRAREGMCECSGRAPAFILSP